MDFPDANNDLKLAMEKLEARNRLEAASTPNRLCENWRFGRPHKHAVALVDLLADTSTPCQGTVTIEAPAECKDKLTKEDADNELLMNTIGSDHILNLHLKRFGKGAVLFIEEAIEDPITITYETDGLFTPTTLIVAAPGAKAHIIERHIIHGTGTLVATRIIQAHDGADIAVELHVTGSGASRAMNITNVAANAANIRHLSAHQNLAWAREETIAELTEGSDVKLFSANRLEKDQFLDQHTRQVHLTGQAASDLLYKNVIDDKATAIFAGNIYVAPGAHNTDAYQSNRNMLLSEKSTVHSLPGLEILADKVRCSHGSASAPMDDEQLFYLLSRGIPKYQAQTLVAEGFLNDVLEKFKA